LIIPFVFSPARRVHFRPTSASAHMCGAGGRACRFIKLSKYQSEWKSVKVGDLLWVSDDVEVCDPLLDAHTHAAAASKYPTRMSASNLFVLLLIFPDPLLASHLLRRLRRRRGVHARATGIAAVRVVHGGNDQGPSNVHRAARQLQKG
jgi:hypothetical protein